MEFRTVQGASVKLLIESLKELTNDVNVRFDASGVHVTAMDGCHCALFHVSLGADKIEEYSCTRSFTVGISLLNLHKLIKNITTNDELEADPHGERLRCTSTSSILSRPSLTWKSANGPVHGRECTRSHEPDVHVVGQSSGTRQQFYGRPCTVRNSMTP
eukprot:jgi/Mesvir1/8428/Mv03599-RA.1